MGDPMGSNLQVKATLRYPKLSHSHMCPTRWQSRHYRPLYQTSTSPAHSTTWSCPGARRGRVQCQVHGLSLDRQAMLWPFSSRSLIDTELAVTSHNKVWVSTHFNLTINLLWVRHESNTKGVASKVLVLGNPIWFICYSHIWVRCWKHIWYWWFYTY